MTKELFIIANWKTNPQTILEANTIMTGYDIKKIAKSTTFVVCPPVPFQVLVLPKSIKLGAQNIDQIGNVTGSYNSAQLNSVGVRYCIVGHSERRKIGETSNQVNKKVKELLIESITPVVCVGENTRDPECHYIQEIIMQVRESLSGITRAQLENVIVAYEPVWAIGSGATRVCTVEECRDVLRLIQKELIEMTGNMPLGRITMIYGGSANGDNAVDYLSIVECSGLLVGRAGLDPLQMNQILAIAK